MKYSIKVTKQFEKDFTKIRHKRGHNQEDRFTEDKSI